MEQEIMETVMRDMLQDLEALKEQKQHLVLLQKGLEAQNELGLRIEQKLSCLGTLPITLSDDQLASLKGALKLEFEAMRTELKKLPATNFNYHSVFPVSFRMEHFRMVVNTVMTWVVILITLSFVIWLVFRYVP